MTVPDAVRRERVAVRAEMSDGVPEEVRRLAVAEEVVAHEWAQFQRVANDGGPADCQGDWPTFHQMRLSQFLTWPLPLLTSYAGDLDAADARGANLLTEKYARMMVSTEPERYARELAPHLPMLGAVRLARQEAVIAVQLGWARELRAAFPRLGRAMRLLTTSQDTLVETSFETYLRGELSTYSGATFARYEAFVEELVAAGENLTTATLGWTVRLGGYADLDEAETALGAPVGLRPR